LELSQDNKQATAAVDRLAQRNDVTAQNLYRMTYSCPVTGPVWPRGFQEF